MLLAQFLGLGPTDDRAWTLGSAVIRDDLASSGQADAYRQATVWRAVNVLAAAVATLPIGTFRRLDRGKEPARGHWSNALVKLRPNAFQTSFRWRHHMMGHVILGGNYYARLLQRGGEVTQLWPLEPSRTRIAEVTASGELVYVYRRRDGGEDRLPQAEVFHVRGFSHDGLEGLSVFELMRSTLSQSSSSQGQRTAFLRNEMRPSVVITHPGDLQKGRENIEASFQKAFGTPSAAGRVLVLDEGMTIAPFAITAKDAQFIESEQFRVEEFLRYIGVPGVLCGYADKTATYASAEAFFQSFKDHNVFPWTRNVEQELTLSLLGAQDELFIEMNLDAMLRPDSKSRAEFYRSLVELGVLTRNEVRELENRNPLPGLDEPLTPLNMSQGAGGVAPTAPPSAAAPVAAVAPSAEPGAEDVGAHEGPRDRGAAEAIVHEVAAGLVRKELLCFVGDAAQGQRGAAGRYAADPKAWRKFVVTFYEKHAPLVAARLKLGPGLAEGYCSRQAAELVAGGVKVCERWESKRVPELVELALGQRTPTS